MLVDARNESRYLRAMNAVMREKYEVPMLTNEVIEVHLASLRAGQEELREDVRELRADNKSIRDKIDAVNAKLTRKIDAMDAKLTQKIDAVDMKLGEKIDAVDANLGEKITKLSNAVAGMRGLQKATLWMMGIFGSLGTVGKFLHWF